MGLSVTVCPQITYDLGRDSSRSSEVKSKGGFGLIGGGFLLVPHSNYGSIWHRLATIHKRDRQTDDRLYDSNMQNILRMVAQKCRHDQTNGDVSAASAI